MDQAAIKAMNIPPVMTETHSTSEITATVLAQTLDVSGRTARRCSV